jgi:hypothetical protein
MTAYRSEGTSGSSKLMSLRVRVHTIDIDSTGHWQILTVKNEGEVVAIR